MKVNIKCPYCNNEEVFTIDSKYYHNNWIFKTTCWNCELFFWVRMRMWDWYHDNEAIKLSCLNWQWCDYSNTINYYWEHTTRVCSECGYEEYSYSDFLKNK